QTIVAVKQHWMGDRASLKAHGQAITDHIGQVASAASGEPGQAELTRTYEVLVRMCDLEHGGFGSAPKFPTPHTFTYLLQHAFRAGKDSAREMAAHSLRAIARGGIHDHVGGGFHRYSTDYEWRLPHFEKMLYDQAQLARAYLEAYQATGDEGLADAARDIFGYVLRDMRDKGGAFYSAEDADSEGEEGKFYVWTLDELKAVLGEKDGARIADVFDSSADGNFHDEATRSKTGANVLHMTKHIARDEYIALRPLLDKLLAHRAKRVRPGLDDKIITSWNGLMIGALALGARVLGERQYVEAAREAAAYIWERHRDKDGALLRASRNGRAQTAAFLDDYAFLADGLLELYQATFEPEHLQRALELTEQMRASFLDRDKGAFFFSAQGQSDLILRQKLFHDGALPAGNSVAARVLLRLAALTGRDEYTDEARGVFRAAMGDMAGYSPAGFTALMAAVDWQVNGMREVVIAVPGDVDASPWLKAINQRYLPDTFVIVRGALSVKSLSAILSFTHEQKPVDGRITAYVCKNRACAARVTDVQAMIRLLS
ncbi:MAG: thioredoxin domain-containing protein, partial [Planctomycetes bacterium]|nr:thioredoxin domain-containing protein [Planctomycetota bacterium]